MLTEKEYIMWLSALNGISRKKKDALLLKFGSAEAIYKASPKSLDKTDFLTDKNKAELSVSRNENKLKKYAEAVYSSGTDYIIKKDDIYPNILREVYDAPLGLYVKGDKTLLKHPRTVSMVGTRHATPYGMAVAEKLAYSFAEKDTVVISGMAEGIDSASHRGAIKAGGKTIAVLGCGVNVCYPKSNKFLMEQILKNGCIVSEYTINQAAAAQNFPYRNRIIAGLSMTLIVAEAAEKGGSLITAGLAIDSGREVFAVPGNITSKASAGTNNLLKQGAAPLTKAEDAYSSIGIEEKIIKITEDNKKSLAINEKLVYDCINSGVSTPDEIILKTGFDISEVQLILLAMEMSGLITKLPGSKYVTL